VSESEIRAALARVEQRQAAYELVAHRIIERLEVQSAQLERLIEAASSVPENSPVATALLELARAMGEHTAAIEALPETLGGLISERVEAALYEEGYDPEQPARVGGVALDGEDEADSTERGPE
jgi:hypothetical protein